MRNDISDLLDFIGRDDVWRDRLQNVVAKHLMPALEEFEVHDDELSELLGEPWPGVLWGCGFEDFLGRRYGDENIVDHYLKRRGWKESAVNQNYFAALRDAPVSLYEITDVKPGISMVLQDLLSAAEPVTVLEKSATRSLKKMGPHCRPHCPQGRSPCDIWRIAAVFSRSVRASLRGIAWSAEPEKA